MLGWHHDSVDVNLSKLWKIKWRTEKPGVLQFMESQRVGHDLVSEQQNSLRRGKRQEPLLGDLC